MTQLVDLKVGPRCNNRCIHCVAANDFYSADLTLDSILAYLDDFICVYSVIDLVLTGGEITVREDFPDILNSISKYKSDGSIRNVHLQTNGRALSAPGLIDIYCDVVDFYLVALHGSDEKVHDSITQRSNSFNETSESLSILSRRIPSSSLATQTVINKQNANNLVDILRFAHESWGIIEMNLTFPHPMGAAYSTKVTPGYLDIASSVCDAMDYCFSRDIHVLTEALPYCVFSPRHYEYIYETSATRLHEAVGRQGDTPNVINYKMEFLNSHVKYPKCSICVLESICQGVWKEYRELYPSDNSIPDPIQL